MKISFTVTKSTKNQKGSFVLTLKYTEKVQFFGQIKDVTRTCYLGGMPNEVAVNTVIVEDTDNFYIKEYPTAMVKDAQNNVKFMDVQEALKADLEHEVLNLKWIHVRTAIEKGVAIEKAA